MGCGNAREKIENEMIALKLERVGVQMERKNQIKLLEDIEGTKIKEPLIPDYIVLPKEKNNVKMTVTQNPEKKKRSKSVNVKKKTKNIKTVSTTSLVVKKRNKMRKSLK